MSLIISYGEDALTYWAITSQLGKVLNALGDDSSLDNVMVVYRPSFGRRGRADPDIAKGKLSAEFGECDAILGTRNAIYIIESKWDSSPEVQGDLIKLKPVQIRRHDIVRWYLNNWRGNQLKDWATFISHFDVAFRAQFPGNKMAPVGSVLAKNLEFLLVTLSRYGTNIQDVLLFIGQVGNNKPECVKPARFRMVALDYQPLVPSGYFRITAGAG